MRVWTLAVALIALCAGGAGAAPDPVLKAQERLTEAMHLEARATGIFETDPTSDESDRLVRASIEILDEVRPTLKGDAAKQVGVAKYGDGQFLQSRESNPTIARTAIDLATMAKYTAIEILDADGLTGIAAGSKPSAPTKVTPPVCRFMSVRAPVLSGCSKTDLWEVYVPAEATRARCVFTGPAGALSP